MWGYEIEIGEKRLIIREMSDSRREGFARDETWTKRFGLSANDAGRIGRIYLYARLMPELSSSRFNGSGVYGFRVPLCTEFPCNEYLPGSLTSRLLEQVSAVHRRQVGPA